MSFRRFRDVFGNAVQIIRHFSNSIRLIFVHERHKYCRTIFRSDVVEVGDLFQLFRRNASSAAKMVAEMVGMYAGNCADRQEIPLLPSFVLSIDIVVIHYRAWR